MTASDIPGKPRYSLIWAPVPGELNARYALDIPKVSKSSPRYLWLKEQMRLIDEKYLKKDR